VFAKKYVEDAVALREATHSPVKERRLSANSAESPLLAMDEDGDMIMKRNGSDKNIQFTELLQRSPRSDEHEI
jgi:hypothetical protein